MMGGDVEGVVWVHWFVATLYSQVSRSGPAPEKPPNRTIVPLPESNDIAAPVRADGCVAGFRFVHVFALGSYTQVSDCSVVVKPPKRTTRPFVESYAIAAPSRALGFEEGASFFQSVASWMSCTVAGAPVPTTSTLLSVPALKSPSVSHVLVAPWTFGVVRTKPITTMATTIRTASARIPRDRPIFLNLRPPVDSRPTARSGSPPGHRNPSGGRRMQSTFLIVCGALFESPRGHGTSGVRSRGVQVNVETTFR